MKSIFPPPILTNSFLLTTLRFMMLPSRYHFQSFSESGWFVTLCHESGSTMPYSFIWLFT